MSIEKQGKYELLIEEMIKYIVHIKAIHTLIA